MTRMDRLSSTLLLLLPVAVLVGGCVSLNKYSVLEERVVDLERESARTRDRLGRGENRIENLYSRFQEDKKALRESGAMRGATLDDVRMHLAATDGKLEALAFHNEAQRQQLQSVIDALDERFGLSLAVRGDALPPDEDGLFKHGVGLLNRGELRDGRATFRIFLERYSKSERVAEARFLIGESYMTEEKYDLAIREFQALHDQHPKSDLLAQTLWRIADALVAQRHCKKAAAVLDYLRQSQRRSDEAKAVPDRIKQIRAECK